MQAACGKSGGRPLECIGSAYSRNGPRAVGGSWLNISRSTHSACRHAALLLTCGFPIHAFPTDMLRINARLLRTNIDCSESLSRVLRIACARFRHFYRRFGPGTACGNKSFPHHCRCSAPCLGLCLDIMDFARGSVSIVPSPLNFFPHYHHFAFLPS